MLIGSARRGANAALAWAQQVQWVVSAAGETERTASRWEAPVLERFIRHWLVFTRLVSAQDSLEAAGRRRNTRSPESGEGRAGHGNPVALRPRHAEPAGGDPAEVVCYEMALGSSVPTSGSPTSFCSSAVGNSLHWPLRVPRGASTSRFRCRGTAWGHNTLKVTLLASF